MEQDDLAAAVAGLCGSYVVVCTEDERRRPDRTVFVGVFGDGVSRNTLDPAQRLGILPENLYPNPYGIVDDANAVFLPVLALTPLLGNDERQCTLADFLQAPPVPDPACYVSTQLVAVDASYRSALRAMLYSHGIGITPGDAGNGGLDRRKLVLSAYDALVGGFHLQLKTKQHKKRARDGSAAASVYPVATVRSALNYQPPEPRLAELRQWLNLVV